MTYFKLSKLFLYLAPLAVVAVTPSTLFPFIVGKYAFFRTAVGLSLVFFLLGVLFNNKYQPISININQYLKQRFRNPLVIAVSIFVLIFVLAGFFGVNPAFSFWSNFERGEGGLQMLYLGVFFLLLILLFKEKSDWQKLFLISIIAGVLMIFYGVFAGLKYIDAETTIQIIDGVPQKILTGQGGPLYQTFKSFIGPDFRDEGYRFAGSIGNPAYVAVYLVFIIFYALYLLIEKYRYRLKSAGAIGLMAVIIFFSIFFFLAATRGAFIGVVVAGLSGLIYLGFSIKSWRKWFLLAGIIALLAVGSLVYFRNTDFVKSLPGGRIFDISFQAENFQNRMVIWKIALDGFKERPLLGWGPENFPVVFDKYYNPKHYSLAAGFGAWYDRAHNIFLDYLTQAGILGLLSFLAIFKVFYWQLFATNSKSKILNHKQTQNSKFRIQNNIVDALLFALPIAYLVQGLALFDILPTYINLFLFLAFATYKFKTLNSKS
jgi:O-antigen ligase